MIKIIVDVFKYEFKISQYVMQYTYEFTDLNGEFRGYTQAVDVEYDKASEKLHIELDRKAIRTVENIIKTQLDINGKLRQNHQAISDLNLSDINHYEKAQELQNTIMRLSKLSDSIEINLRGPYK